MTRKRKLRDTVGRALALVSAMALAGCSSSAPVRQLETSSLCDRGKRIKTIRVAHIDERGEAFEGDAPRGEYDGVVKKVATAVAAPKTGVFKRRVRKDCYDKVKKVWYPCVAEASLDFTKIKGIVRAPKMSTARNVAVTICENEVRKASPKAEGFVRFDSEKFDCTIIQAEYCPVYKATAAQKKQKKRLAGERAKGRPKFEIDPKCPSTSHCLPKRR